MAACVLPGFNPAPRRAGTTVTRSCGLGHLPDTLFCLSPLFSCSLKALVMHSGLSSLYFRSCSCVFSMWCFPPFLSISLSFTSPHRPSQAGTLTLRNDLDGRLHFLRTSLWWWWWWGTLLFCVDVYFHLSRTASSFSGAYWRVSTLLLLLSHHSFNKQVHLFCS